MRVLTWNLWGRYGPWQRRRDAIAATLAGIRPDVCGLQEVWATSGENLAADLAGRLGMSYHWVAAAPAGPDGMGGEVSIGNAILSRWPIGSRAHTALPVDGGTEGRVALYAGLDTPTGRVPMVTTHLTYRLGGSRARLAQVRRLAEFVAEHAVGAGHPPVVTGDLNAEPDSDELRLLGGLRTAPAVAGQVLLDAWRYVADPTDPGFTWHLSNPYQADSLIPDSRIDHILVGPPMDGRGRVRSVRVAGNAPVAGVWPSDHYAVVADLDDGTDGSDDPDAIRGADGAGAA